MVFFLIVRSNIYNKCGAFSAKHGLSSLSVRSKASTALSTFSTVIRSRKDIQCAAAGKNTKVEQFQMQKLRKVSRLKTSMISRRPPNAPTANPPPIILSSAVRSGFSISGEWDPLGMRGTVSRNLTI